MCATGADRNSDTRLLHRHETPLGTGVARITRCTALFLPWLVGIKRASVGPTRSFTGMEVLSLIPCRGLSCCPELRTADEEDLVRIVRPGTRIRRYEDGAIPDLAL